MHAIGGTNLFHDLRPLLVTELQLSNGFVDAHPSDLWRRTNREMTRARSLPTTVSRRSPTSTAILKTCSAHHFSQIPHLVFAVLNLSPTVMDLL